MKSRWGFIIVVMCLGVHAVPAHAKTDALAPLQKILELPEESISIEYAIFTIEKIMDPTVDISKNIQLIDQLELNIKKMSGKNELELINVIKYLYDSGKWNNFNPYSYDFECDEGNLEKILVSNKVSNYLKTRRGTCVSMPVLFYILARRAEKQIYFTNAPTHIFLKAQKKDASWVNIETTSYPSFQTDSYYIKELEISDLALKNGIYLNPLSNKKAVAMLAKEIVVYYVYHKQYKEALLASNLILNYYPNDPSALVNKAAAYSKWINSMLDEKPESKMDKEEIQNLQFMRIKRDQYFAEAKALGWQEESNKKKKDYSAQIQTLREAYR